jgi:hypothetical protein
MTFKEYTELDLTMRLLIVKSMGELVAHLNKGNESLLCYSVEKFFVEVIYERNTTNLLRLVTFEGGRQLDKYSNLSTEI